MTPDQYRELARECLSGAEKATTEEERQAFLESARNYTQAALRLEGVPPQGFPMQPSSNGKDQHEASGNH
jgi:hypothetical protein